MNNDAGLIRTWVIAFVLAATAGFAGLIGIGCAIGANACPFGEKTQITATDGETLWFASCAACHGSDASGGAGPSLIDGESSDLTLEELQEKISRGKPFKGMPRFKGDFNEEQIENVARYVVTLRGGTP